MCKGCCINRAEAGIGTLGAATALSGKQDGNGNLYLVVHSGSRHLGKQVAQFYQELGYKELVAQVKLLKTL